MPLTKSSNSNNCYGWGCLVIFLVFLFLIMMPFPTKIKPKAKEAESKANLHMIQLAIERYAVDHDGQYPAYLIGGRAAQDGNGGWLSDSACDPLIREGYMPSYPKNPFAVGEPRKKLLELQASLASSHMGEDPLRPGYPEGDLLGYRFGEDGTHMGQVLCDPRWEYWDYTDPATAETRQLHTWADVEYWMWDTWDDKKKAHGDGFLEGQFFYKSIGPILIEQAADGADGESAGSAVQSFIPTEIDQYIMGVYGSRKTPGKDILGSITPVAPYDNGSPNLFSQLKWLRSEYAEDGTEGCPYSFDPNANEDEVRIAYGNPNGIADGVILVLTAGEDITLER